jgi:hypothetical protein
VDDYSEVAAAQLDELETTADDDLWEALLDACELALRFPAKAQSLSAAVTTDDGTVVLRLTVAGFPPYKVFWSNKAPGPRVEAVFEYPSE